MSKPQNNSFHNTKKHLLCFPWLRYFIKIEYTYRRGTGKVYIYILFTALQESDIFVQQFKGDRQQIVVAQNVYLSLITVHQLRQWQWQWQIDLLVLYV